MDNKIIYSFVIYLMVSFGYVNAQQLQGNAIAPLPRKDMGKVVAVDSGNLRITYALNAEDITNPDTYIDLQCLEIGTSFSKYYSRFVYNNDSLVLDWRKKHPDADFPRWLGLTNRRRHSWSEYKYSEYYKDYGTNTITEYARMPFGVKTNRQCLEAIPTQSWTIRNEKLTINGYVCQKATCRFRGRSYTAWFTQDIPISNGPWKFGGLPGLILKVYDNKRLYTFECVKIEQTKFQIKKYEYKDHVPMDRLELLKLQRMLNEDYYKAIGAKMRDGKPLPNPVSYEPLELE